MDIQKIKLGNQVYDIKDVISRTGFATASIVHDVTDSTVNNGNTQFSGIVFYADENKTTPLGTVKLSQLIIPALASQYIATNIIESNTYAVSNPTDGIVDSSSISIKLVNNKPVVSFNSTTTGTTPGTSTEVQLPVGQSGTVALVSDINTAMANKVGYGSKSVTTPNEGAPYTSLNYYVDQNASTPLFTIDLDEIQTTTLTSAGGNFGLLNALSIGFKDQNGTTTNFHPDQTYIMPTTETENNTAKKFYTFHVGGSSGPTHTVVLPMDADGTIALTSDLTSLQNAISDINDVLDLNGEDVTTTIDTFNEVKEFLENYSTSDDLASLLAGKIEGITYDESGSSPVLKYTKTSGGSATSVVTLDTTPTSGSKKPITSGAVYTLEQAVVKKIELNGKESTPSSGKVTLQDVVTKIQLNGKDQTLSKTASTGEGKINLTSVVTNITMNGTAVSGTENTTNGTYTVALSETDPVFSASAAAGITSSDILNWNSAASGGVTNVSYTTSGSGNSTKHLIQKTVGGTTTSVVELPTATYDSTNETLELILATTPSS